MSGKTVAFEWPLRASPSRYPLKTPATRLRDFNNAGRAHNCKLEYSILVRDPYSVEQEIHRLLKDSWRSLHENKEWFRLVPKQAVETIRWFVGLDYLFEEPERPENWRSAIRGPNPHTQGNELVSNRLIECGGCGQKLRVPVRRAGIARCSRCGHTNRVSA